MTIDKKFYQLGDIAVAFVTVDGVTETVFIPEGMQEKLNDEKLAGISPLGWMISPEAQHVILPSVHSHNSICIDPARKAHRRQGLKSPLRRISHRVPGTDPL